MDLPMLSFGVGIKVVFIKLLVPLQLDLFLGGEAFLPTCLPACLTSLYMAK